MIRSRKFAQIHRIWNSFIAPLKPRQNLAALAYAMLDGATYGQRGLKPPKKVFLNPASLSARNDSGFRVPLGPGQRTRVPDRPLSLGTVTSHKAPLCRTKSRDKCPTAAVFTRSDEPHMLGFAVLCNQRRGPGVLAPARTSNNWRRRRAANR
jgi:hypothetical protein